MTYFNQQCLEKLNDTSTKMYFNQQGLEKVNDTSTKMYFTQQGLESYTSIKNFSCQRGLE